jgi:endoglucanase
MKTHFTTLTALKHTAVALTVMFGMSTAQAVAQTDPLTGETAMEISHNIKVGWNLGNSLDATGTADLSSEWSWGNPATTQQMIDSVKAAGFNAIRIPVSWGKHTSNNGTYTYAVNAQWMARVKQVVDYCFNRNMYVIINLHHDLDYYFPSSAHINESTTYVRELWTQIAHEFANYDQHLIFETLNEPRLQGDPKYEWWFWMPSPASQVVDAINCINTLNQTAVTAIRSVNEGYNRERVIGCPGYAASIDGCTVASTVSFKLPTDNVSNRLWVSIHAYTPFDFCMSGTGSTTFTADHQKTILNLFKTINDKFLSKGIPAYIGETGATNKGDREEIAKWAACFFGYSKQYGVPCFLWDNDSFYKQGGATTERFGLFDRHSVTWGERATVNAIMAAVGVSPTEVMEPLANSANVYVSQGNLYASCSATINRIDVYGINGMALSSTQFDGNETSAELEMPTMQGRVAIVVINTSAGKVVKKVILQ